MKIVKKIGVLASALTLALGVGAVQAADMSQIKVAVVNVQQVLQQSPRVAELSKKLEAQFKGRQTKINDEQKALQASVDKFNKESPTMNDKTRADTEKSISNTRAALVKEVVQYQQDLQKEQNKIMQGLLNDLNGIVSNIAKTNSYSLVLDAQAVIYAADGNDITKDVAKQFNNK
jgi:outer membrane protein